MKIVERVAYGERGQGSLVRYEGVATWFSEGGRLAPESIADRYVEMILRSVDRRAKGLRS